MGLLPIKAVRGETIMGYHQRVYSGYGLRGEGSASRILL